MIALFAMLACALASPVPEPEAKADPQVILTSSPLVAPAAVRIVADHHHSLPLIYPHHLAHPWIYPGIPAGVVLRTPHEVIQANL